MWGETKNCRVESHVPSGSERRGGDLLGKILREQEKAGAGLPEGVAREETALKRTQKEGEKAGVRSWQ